MKTLVALSSFSFSADQAQPLAVFAGLMAGCVLLAFAGTGWQRLADGSFETTVAAQDKLALLARLLADPGTVADLTVTEPTLDDLYAHFLRREAA